MSADAAPPVALDMGVLWESGLTPGQDGVDDALVAEVAQHVLGSQGLTEAELSVVMCDDAFIQPLNRDWRAKDKPTDVLSFPQHEGELGDAEDPVLGDVIISVETARRQAAARGHSARDEVVVLLVHGLLHLLGYDHIQDDEAEEMEALERRLLGRWGATVARTR